MQSEEVCREKHKYIETVLNTHGRRLNIHGDRLDRLELGLERLNGLIAKVEQLVSILKWFTAATVTALITFFFFAIQANLF